MTWHSITNFFNKNVTGTNTKFGKKNQNSVIIRWLVNFDNVKFGNNLKNVIIWWLENFDNVKQHDGWNKIETWYNAFLLLFFKCAKPFLFFTFKF